MTGLYLREMLTRWLISRVLIVPPAGLVGNWEHEMRTLFNLLGPLTRAIPSSDHAGAIRLFYDRRRSRIDLQISLVRRSVC